MKALFVWGIRGLKVLVLVWILFPLFFGFEPLERKIAGFSLLHWGLFFGIGLLVVSMILHRILIGPPVLTEEEEKEWEKEQKELEEWNRKWFLHYDPSIPGNIGYEDSFDHK